MTISQDAPDIRILWQKASRARKEYHCDRCGDALPVGELYESLGIIIDGEFRHERTHCGPMCPHERVKALAEDLAQYNADKVRYFPDVSAHK